MKCAIVLMLAGGAAAAVAAPRVTIELRPEVRTAAAVVTLGQAARLASSDLALLRRLVDLPLGRAPAAGHVSLLEREVLASWLRRRTGLDREQVVWSGPATSQVLAASRSVGGEAIAAVAAAALRRWLATGGSGAEIELVAPPRDVPAVEGDLRLLPRDLAHAQLRSRMTVWVEVWSAGRFQRVVPVTYAVTGVEAGAPAGPLVQEGLARQLDARPAPAVTRGAWAALQSREGVVSTEARVQVLQDGHVGDQVRVRASAAAPALLVRVTGTGRLEVAR